MPNITSFNPENFEKGNIGWLFTKAYYEGIDFDYLLLDANEADNKLKNNAKMYEVRSKALVNKKWDNFKSTGQMLKENGESMHIVSGNPFNLTVENPGLLYGSGITHESGNEGEFKIGFLFDYVTGLVIIPGHSIKGNLRQWFKQDTFADYISNEDELKDIRTRTDDLSLTEQVIKLIEIEMFGDSGNEERKSVYEKDIFHDAILIGSNHSNNLFLGKDSITPHTKGSLKNPTPLPFIKLLPNTVMRFNFDFKDGILSKENKLKLVKRLLLDFGIGAKTNVGYGQFK